MRAVVRAFWEFCESFVRVVRVWAYSKYGTTNACAFDIVDAPEVQTVERLEDVVIYHLAANTHDVHRLPQSQLCESFL